MIRPRDYQLRACQSIPDYFLNGGTGNPLVLMPTGTGKSVVIAMFLWMALNRYSSQKVLVLTHVQELIEQNHARLLDVYPNAPAGIHSAGLGKSDYLQPIIFGGIGSVAKKPHIFGKVSLVLIDEAHLVSDNESTQYRKFILALLEVNPNLKVVGFTATDWRLGTGKLTEGDNRLFTDICFDNTKTNDFNELIDEGYLVKLIPKRTKTQLDVEGVHMRGGEFNEKELQLAVDKEHITIAALREAMEIGADRHSWLIFCSGVEHSIHAAEILTDLGIPCEAVHSKLTKDQRKDILRRFKSGELRAVTNNNVLTTGFDHPALDMIICLRPTASCGLWVQMLGRGTRPLYDIPLEYRDLANPLETKEGRLAAIENSQKKNCLVLDFAKNSWRLGPINDPVVPNKKGKGTGEAPVKICEVCETINHASARHCIDCGTEFKFACKLQTEASTTELIKFDLPVVEIFRVEYVTVTIHHKADKPPSLKVSYYCGFKCFHDYVCIEHEGFAARKAVQWWKERERGAPVPLTTSEAQERINNLRMPTHLRVHMNVKYPAIMAYDFDGTAFGTKEAEIREIQIQVPALMPKTVPKVTQKWEQDLEDDLPF